MIPAILLLFLGLPANDDAALQVAKARIAYSVEIMKYTKVCKLTQPDEPLEHCALDMGAKVPLSLLSYCNQWLPEPTRAPAECHRIIYKIQLERDVKRGKR